MRVEVQYYGALREIFGVSSEFLDTQVNDCAALWHEACGRHQLQVAHDGVRVAIDDRFADWNTPLAQVRCVAFMPPFAGG